MSRETSSRRRSDSRTKASQLSGDQTSNRLRTPTTTASRPRPAAWRSDGGSRMRPCTSISQSAARLASRRVSAFTGLLNAGSAASCASSLRPLRRRVGGEALVEERHHHLALVAERAAEGRRHRQPALGVDPVVISPFEHSELGVFHTFFHFSTPASLEGGRRGRRPRDICPFVLSVGSAVRSPHSPGP